jgi:hypothetical protein
MLFETVERRWNTAHWERSCARRGPWLHLREMGHTGSWYLLGVESGWIEHSNKTGNLVDKTVQTAKTRTNNLVVATSMAGSCMLLSSVDRC